MSDRIIAPTSTEELSAIVAGETCVLAVGNQTKKPLSACDDPTLVSLRSIRGMIEYEPSEFTFTARAGTPVSEISAMLAEKGQYLPFDPMLVDAGATIGGTVAAGLSGPGRFRYGGIRDFLLGVRFLSGDGNWINAGGKVVKNAAGFDIPKFLVGSLGRFGVMTELTFKVFPKPTAVQTLRVISASHQEAVKRIASAASERWELDAVDYRPSEQTIYLRIGGPEESNRAIAAEIRSSYGDDVAELDDAATFWQSVRELNWAGDSSIAVKVPMTASQISACCERLDVDQLHFSVAGNVAWILLRDLDDVAKLDSVLHSLQLPGLLIRGLDDGSYTQLPALGFWQRSDIHSAVKTAMDPPAKFPAIL